MTSQIYSGDFGKQAPGTSTGPAAADELCQLAGDGAALGGKFKAFLATDTRGPADDLADVGPWFLVGGKGEKLFNNKANLSTSPLVDFNRDEQGNAVNDFAWTGTGATGVNCTNWTTDIGGFKGAIGPVGSTSAWRSGVEEGQCNFSYHLYCFEQ